MTHLSVKTCRFIIHSSKTYTVKLYTPEGETSIEVAEDEYLLDALRRSEVDSPSMCLQGWCLRCAAYLEKGEVDMSNARRYFEADREANFILLCSAKPKSDLVIRTHQKGKMVKHRIEHTLPAPRG